MNKKNLSFVVLCLVASPITMSGEYLMKITTGDSFDFWHDINEVKGKWIDEGSFYSCGQFSSFNDLAMPQESYSQVRKCKLNQSRENIVEEYDPFTDKSRSKTVVEYQTIDVEDTRTVFVRATEWIDTGEPYNCNDPSLNSEKEFSFHEMHLIAKCSQDQESKNEHIVDGRAEYLVSVDQTVEVDSYSIVARDKDSCLSLYNQDKTLKNGFYPLNSGEFYCDMAGGGWTKLADIKTSSASAGSFVKREKWSGGSNYPGYSGDTLGWWMKQDHIPSSYSDRNVIISSKGISWKDARINIKPLYWASVDGFNNVHGYTSDRDSIDGMFLDGLALFSDGNLIKAFTTSDNSSRRKTLGISSSQFHAGRSPASFNYSQRTSKASSFTLKAISDQYWKDEEVGFEYMSIFVK